MKHQTICKNFGFWEEINTQQLYTWSYLSELRCVEAIDTAGTLILAKS